MTIVHRGPSTASKKAARYLSTHPTATARQLAVKFGLNITTIYRSAWWKNHHAGA